MSIYLRATIAAISASILVLLIIAFIILVLFVMRDIKWRNRHERDGMETDSGCFSRHLYSDDWSDSTGFSRIGDYKNEAHEDKRSFHRH